MTRPRVPLEFHWTAVSRPFGARQNCDILLSYKRWAIQDLNL